MSREFPPGRQFTSGSKVKFCHVTRKVGLKKEVIEISLILHFDRVKRFCTRRSRCQENIANPRLVFFTPSMSFLHEFSKAKK